MSSVQEINAVEFIAQGRRELVCGEVVKAVASFQKACEIIAKDVGDLHESLAEPNLLYGTALLELARMENNVLGNALEGETEKEEIAEKVIDAMCTEESMTNEKDTPENEAKVTDEKSKSEAEAEEPVKDSAEEAKLPEIETNHCSTESEESKAEPDTKPLENDDKEKSETENGEADAAGDTEQVDDEEDESGEEGAEDEVPVDEEDKESEDISNLQLAWECIEVAKTIFGKSDTKADKLKVADCLEKLAEISREKEDYEQAISDIKEAMTIRQSLLNEADRVVAETYYQIGTTHAVAGNLDEAKSSFESCVTCLKKAVEEAESVLKKLKESDQDANSEEISNQEKTVTELNELIPDIQKRIAEIEEDQQEEKKISTIKVAETSTFGSESNTSAPATDISHLVKKKKRVPEDEAIVEKENINGTTESPEKSPFAKKMKVVNGDDESKISNGVEETPLVEA